MVFHVILQFVYIHYMYVFYVFCGFMNVFCGSVYAFYVFCDLFMSFVGYFYVFCGLRNVRDRWMASLLCSVVLLFCSLVFSCVV